MKLYILILLMTTIHAFKIIDPNKDRLKWYGKEHKCSNVTCPEGTLCLEFGPGN